ncbi:DUF2800 domain-containing protein [Pseudolactococcus reticulitermitis]|uniref:PD-(D/E)XK endonuclease-like domain-containing protein n=1 Tax=Pseudolactococcus reticulitermitis TaxID=2025039 RepID=A0A224WX16_9LACT|nr:DUF2800 domain-containing protein [Lactococcus reticulitermitis]GAX46797.1 hypothetical protein RsY01_377 [Lactococcus reticulitermitis]
MATPEEHAILSASSSSRWLHCTPSVVFAAPYDKERKDTTFTAEGTAAHALAELKLSFDTGKITKRKLNAQLKKFKAENEYYSTSFEEFVDDYVGFVNETVATYDHPEVELEQRVNFSDWVPDGYGTSDVVIMTDSILHIVDLKFGKGVPVSAVENTQLMLYALGTYYEFNMAYDFDTVRMTIHQPRLYDTSTYELSVEELLDWAETFVKPRAELAMAGEGDYAPSDKACQWCPAKAVCKARADKNLQNAIKYDFADSNELETEAISDVLSQAKEIKKWLEDVEEYALVQARDEGKHFPGWKLVAGRSNRKITNADVAASLLTDAGFTEIFKPRELLTLTAIEKMVGKKQFGDLLNDIIVKPEGKPTLVVETDKRPEISSHSQAVKDFE